MTSTGDAGRDDRFTRVDAHLDEVFGGADPVLTDALHRSQEAELPAIAVSSNIGRFLRFLVLACGARRVLEIGTLGGYSTIWLARGLPSDGHITTLEYEPRHADIARQNLDAAGLRVPVEIRVGAAIDTLQALATAGTEPFDLVFIDADKEGYPAYLDAVVPLSRSGTLIVADNVVRHGAIADGPSDDASVTGIQRFNAALAAHPALEAPAILQVVGTKGHDGLAFAVVTDP